MSPLYLIIKNKLNKSFLFFLFISLFFFQGYESWAQPLSGNYNVGTGQTYTTITAAISDLTSKGVNAPVTFTLMDAVYSSSETFPITIGSYSGSSSTNTVILRPTSSSSAVSISSANGTATFDLNGVSNFTIDGRPGSSGSTIVMTIINTNVSGVAVRLTNDATNNTIKYCDVQGQNTVSVPALTTNCGVIYINSANTTNLVGNDNNTIANCNVHGTGSSVSNFPTIGIAAYGTQTTTGSYNDNCTITNCNIYDIYNSSLAATHVKIDLGNTAWTITNNHFYQTTSIDYLTSSAVYRALWVTPNVSNISNAANGFLISGNFVGGANASGTGSYTLTGSSSYSFWVMDVSVGLGAATSVQNNTITNINMTTPNPNSTAMEGINIANGNVNVGTVTGNLVGSTTSTPGIIFNASANTGGPIAIRTGGGTNNVINIANNTVGGFTLNSSNSVSAIFNGINAAGGTTVNITNNTVGSPTVANSIYAPAPTTSSSLQSIRGIIVNVNSITGSVTGNLIANMTTNSVATGSQGSSVVGIYIASTSGAFTVSGNTIMNLSSASQTSASGANSPVIGIAYLGTVAPAVISGNTIHSLKLTHSFTLQTTYLTGIYFSGPTGTTNSIDKNLIHSFSTTAIDTALINIRGIDIASGAANISNNMIRLGVTETGNNLIKSVIMTGINEDGGTNNFYFNSVYIGGDSVGTGSFNSYAFLSNLSNVAREIKNNIFMNVRKNRFSTGNHYAVKLTALVSQSLIANDYWNGSSFLSQLGTTDYSSFTSWRTATAQDSLSLNVNPLFKNPTGNSSAVDLHIDTAGTAVSFLESGGIAISSVSIDFDNQSRPGPTGSTKGGGVFPDIGADEFDGVPRPLCSNSTAGSASASLDTICVGSTIVISLTGSTGIGVGNGYQWQSSSNGVNFTDISGANQSTYTVNAIAATAYYRCIVTCYFGSTSSTSSAKKITVLNPQITATSPAQICGPGTLALGATAAAGKITWYANATGGTPLDTGITFTTPFLSATTTYYVDATYNGCASATRTAVVATIKTIPTITGVTSNSICGPGSMVLSASTGAGTIDWYTSATGGTSFNTGLSYTTPTLSATTTYYVGVTANGCVSASRTPVTATIIPLPFISSTSPSGTCGSGKVVLGATANSGTIYWYSASSGGTLLDSGTTFTTPTIFSPTTYYLEVRLNNCTSATRTPIVASIYSNPTINGTTAGSGCIGDKITLGASASAGIINWYASATGGSSLGTGTSFTTPSLTVTTTYYVDATNNGCVSSFRTPAKATINPLPMITNITNASACGTNSLVIGAIASGGIVNWFADSVGGPILGSGPTFTTSALTATDTFYAEAKDNGCNSYPRTPVIAKIKKIPTITGTTPASSCKPSSLVLSATASAGAIKWYSVSFGGGVLFTGNSYTTPVLSSSATYYIDATDSGCTTATRTSVDASIYPSLNKTTTLNGFTITASATGVSYQWVNCNNGFQAITGETSQSYTPTVNGSYAVILKNANCTDTSACVTISKIGINSKTGGVDISLSPNPANDYFILKSGPEFSGVKITITDNLGRVVMRSEINAENLRINIHDLSAGVYMLNIGEENTRSFKLIKN